MDHCTDLEKKRERRRAYDRAYRIANKAKRNARHRHRYATEPEFRAKLLALRAKNQRKDYLKKHYGMSLEDYDVMMARQHGACAICERKFKKLCVDHCHKTRKLRRLLC